MGHARTSPSSVPGSLRAALATESARVVASEAAGVARQHVAVADRSALLPAYRMQRAVGRAVQDLHALVQRDPAAHGSWRYVWNTYSSFRAVLAYRVAHALHTGGQGNDCPERCAGAARAIMETAKVQTGVEIHPAAVIGRRFVLDHGVGTVIGETAMIGDDCYVLQGVVVGARGIADNPDERRHPRLGHRVEVGGLARILGPITIGDDVVIGCGTMVTDDVPARCTVRLVNQYQLTSGQSRARVFGVVPVVDAVEVHGVGLAGAHAELVAPGGDWAVPVPVVAAGNRLLRCAPVPVTGNEVLRLREPGGAELLIVNLHHVWRELRLLQTDVGATR
jgi:serine O-acetyltransferase